MASMKLLVIVAFVASVFCGVQCQEETPSGPNAVDMVTQPQGQHAVFPYFSQDLKTINANLKEYFDKDADESLDLMNKVMGDALRNGKGLGTITLIVFTSKLITMCNQQESRRKPFYGGINIRKEFNTATTDMFMKLLKMTDAKYAIVREQPKDYQKLAKDLDEFFSTLKQVLKSSPVGFYIDFEHGKIGDSSFMDVSSDMMARLKHHGYSQIFGCIEKLLLLIKALTK